MLVNAHTTTPHQDISCACMHSFSFLTPAVLLSTAGVRNGHMQLPVPTPTTLLRFLIQFPARKDHLLCSQPQVTSHLTDIVSAMTQQSVCDIRFSSRHVTVAAFPYWPAPMPCRPAAPPCCYEQAN